MATDNSQTQKKYRALVVRELVKDVSQLQVSTVDEPAISDRQVLVRVEAAGANFFDILICQGKYQTKPSLPFTPGAEFAGVVTKVGAKVRNVRPGDRVCGNVPYGSFSQVLAVEARGLLPIPDNMPFDEAAGFLITNATAYFALVVKGNVQEGETILIHAAAGGVGLAAVQIARALGAIVIGTCGSDAKCKVALQAGCHHVINYNTDKNWPATVKKLTKNKGVDVVYDPVGSDIFDLSLKCTAWSGRLLVIGFAGGRIPQVATNRLLLNNMSVIGVYFGSYVKHNPAKIVECMQALMEWYSQGKLKVIICGKYGLDEIPEALMVLGNRQSYGKVVILPQVSTVPRILSSKL